MTSKYKSQARSNLHQQDLTKVDVTKLSALSPEVISRQATINIGHVAHGKSTVVKTISGVKTVRFKNELERYMTIKLERLPDSVLRKYRQRSDERTFLGKTKTVRFKNELERNMTIKLKRLPDSVLRKYRQRSDERTFLGKTKTVRFKNELERNMTIKLKRLPDSVLRKYRQRSDERTFLGKTKTVRFKNELERNMTIKLKRLPDSVLRKYRQRSDERTFLGKTKTVRFKNELERNMTIKLKRLPDSVLRKYRQRSEESTFLGKTKTVRFKNELERNMTIKLKRLPDSVLRKYRQRSEESTFLENIKRPKRARNTLQFYKLTRRRCRQLKAIRNWEDHMNQVDKSKKLSVENDVDFAGPPENFNYINESIPGAGVTIPNEPPTGCDCVACNCRAKSCCGMQAGQFAYTAQKRLRVALGTPIYECNKSCKCSSECNNRVVQKGRNVKLTIFRTPNGCGWGVRAAQKIKQGQFICQYVGEIITFEEAEERGKDYDANGMTYLFDLDFYSCENLYVIDACKWGNVSHFINHSCDPNSGVWVVWADCIDPNLPMIALFATRDIEMGEEICFVYLKKCNEQNIISFQNRTKCKCGAIKCRKYVF